MLFATRFKWTTFALWGALFLPMAARVNAENILHNGSFESPSLTPGNYGNFTFFLPGNTNLLNWTIGGTGSLYLGSPPKNQLAAFAGRQYVDFNGKNVTLSQSFSTTVGEIYDVSFVVGRYQSTTPLQLTAVILSGDGAVITNVLANAPTDAGWSEPITFRFVAATPVSTLQFTNASAGIDVDLELDNVVVELAPHLSIELDGSNIKLSWKSSIGDLYQLRYQSNLETNHWLDLGFPFIGTGSNDFRLLPISEEQRFYRLYKLPGNAD